MNNYSRAPEIQDITPATKNILQTYRIKSKVDINMHDYMKRIQKYTKFEDAIFVAAMLLLERSIDLVPELKNSNCFHK